MTTNKRILISGAGISGLTLAYWLQHWSFSPTIVEKRPDLLEQGYMIDFYGSGFDVAEKMDLLEQLQVKSSQYPITKLEFVDGQGRPRATLNIEEFRKLLHHRYFPLMRGDLESTLLRAIRGKVPIRFNTSITTLDVQEARGLAGSFVPRNNFEIAVAHFFLNAAFWPGFRSLFAKQIGARSIIQ